MIDDLTQDLLNEVANNIPITKIINSLRKTGLSISDYVFMRKLAQFLTGVQDIDESIRKKIQKSSFDEKAKKELIEKIVLAIERLDEIKKADALFKIFIAYTTGKINKSEFNAFCHALDRINDDDITKLREFYLSRQNQEQPLIIKAGEQEDPSLQSFAFVGLIQLRPVGGALTIERENSSLYLTNDRGRCFLKVLGLIDKNETE
ncbi:MAG: hypothetical protein WBA77_08680 [Microcoleaceae cyanobacterium]